jgi:Probable zinc-ribbon domain
MHPLPATPTIPADPSQWSEASQRTLSAIFIKEYKDKVYRCWHCQMEAVFTAADQKYTYEVKKAPIDQQRILCQACWRKSIEIARTLNEYTEAWAASKPRLRQDFAFLKTWLQLLEKWETYVPHKQDVARKNMLQKLISASDA